MIRPGVACGELDAAVNEFLRAEGYDGAGVSKVGGKFGTTEPSDGSHENSSSSVHGGLPCPAPDLTPEQAELRGTHLSGPPPGLRRPTSASMAELLASKPDDQLLGRTEFEVRDLVHDIGAKALQTALDERKKGATKGPA